MAQRRGQANAVAGRCAIRPGSRSRDSAHGARDGRSRPYPALVAFDEPIIAASQSSLSNRSTFACRRRIPYPHRAFEGDDLGVRLRGQRRRGLDATGQRVNSYDQRRAPAAGGSAGQPTAYRHRWPAQARRRPRMARARLPAAAGRHATHRIAGRPGRPWARRRDSKPHVACVRSRQAERSDAVREQVERSRGLALSLLRRGRGRVP